jgi:spermidine/putrescine transport system permease protein
MLKKFKPKEFHFLLFPPYFWLIIFFVVPVIIILIYSLGYQNQSGKISAGLNFDNYGQILNYTYFKIFIRSFGYALLSTVISLAIAFPISYYLAFTTQKMRLVLMFLIILPFWVNFLLRIYSFLIILGSNGVINNLLIGTGIISQPLSLLNNLFSVQIGFLYYNLPYMILPILASLDRMDVSMLEASMDLGANKTQTFWKITFPYSLPGVVAGIIFVFVPTLGSFIIPEFLGGTDNVMIGNIITEQFLVSRNWTFGSSLSVVMIFIVMIFITAYIRFSNPSKNKYLI